MTDGDAARARTIEILKQVLTPHVLQRGYNTDTPTLDDLAEAVEYLSDEIDQQGIALPEALAWIDKEERSACRRRCEDALADLLGGEMTLGNLEAHALYPLVLATLQEVLGFEEDAAVAVCSTIVEDTLRSCLEPNAPVSSAPDPRTRHRKGTLGECELCERSMPLTEHHLIPRSEHHRLAAQGVHTLVEMRSRLAMLCRPCHNTVHSMFSQEDLAARYNTMDALLQHQGVCKWGKYASKLKERQAGYEGFGLRNKR